MSENKEIMQEPNTASSVIYHIEKVSKRWIVFASVAFVTLGVTLGGALYHQMSINYQNDKEWRELFGSYDYVSQDGGGYNNLNTGNQGDVNNGTEVSGPEK